MNIFITGASGFVGGAVAKSLSSEHKVFAMARSQSSSDKVTSLGCQPVLCDLKTISEDLLKKIDVVIHCAAYAEEWGTFNDFYEANVLGTQHLVETAKQAGVKRFIHISTEAALFHGQDMINIDESYPFADKSPYAYSSTKAEAEKIVRQANAKKFTTIALRPRLVWGPGDVSILPALIKMIKQGKFAWIGGGHYQTSTTHIENLVHAVTLTLTRGQGGEAYFISDADATEMRKFLENYLASQGIRPGKKTVPKFLVRSVGYSLDLTWKLFRIKAKPPIVRFSVDIMSAHCTLNISKATQELGYAPKISRQEGLMSMPRLSLQNS